EEPLDGELAEKARFTPFTGEEDLGHATGGELPQELVSAERNPGHGRDDTPSGGERIQRKNRPLARLARVGYPSRRHVRAAPRSRNPPHRRGRRRGIGRREARGRAGR